MLNSGRNTNGIKSDINFRIYALIIEVFEFNNIQPISVKPSQLRNRTWLEALWFQYYGYKVKKIKKD